MKVKKVEICWEKISLTFRKWSNLNAPTTETPVSHPLLGTTVEMFPLRKSSVRIPETTSLVNGASEDGWEFLVFFKVPCLFLFYGYNLLSI